MIEIKITGKHPRLSDEVGSTIKTTNLIATWIVDNSLGEVVPGKTVRATDSDSAEDKKKKA